MANTFSKILKIHPKDNIVVTLRDLMKGDTIQMEDDEFKLSGISANPTLGNVSDLIVGLGCSAIISVFP